VKDVRYVYGYYKSEHIGYSPSISPPFLWEGGRGGEKGRRREGALKKSYTNT